MSEDHEIRFLKNDDGTPGLEVDERLALLAVCVVSQQAAGFKDVVDLREAHCPQCSAPGFNTGWGVWKFTCGAEVHTDEEGTFAEHCPKAA